MRQPNRPWRDDRLGSQLKSGLSPWREAQPRDEVWGRIAAELAPTRPQPRRRGVSFQRATILSIALVLGLAATGLRTERRYGSSSFYAAPESGWGLSTLEFQMAQQAAAGPWDRIMPPAPLRARGYVHEAYNRAQWLWPETTESPGSPLGTVAGL